MTRSLGEKMRYNMVKNTNFVITCTCTCT